jgi:hypothetical protein
MLALPKRYVKGESCVLHVMNLDPGMSYVNVFASVSCCIVELLWWLHIQ